MREVAIAGPAIGLDSVRRPPGHDTTRHTSTIGASEQAFPLSAMTPVDVNVAEVHHFFTRVDVISYEDVGFAGLSTASAVLETRGNDHRWGIGCEDQQRIERQALSAVAILEGPVIHG